MSALITHFEGRSEEVHSPQKYGSRARVDPIQVAKAHCANFNNGGCLGMCYHDNLSVKSCHSLPKCLLDEPVQRCPYFEEVVMRINVDDSTLSGAKRKEHFDEGIRQYKLANGLLTSEDTARRLCPECEQRLLEGKKRFCSICRDKRRKKTQKLANRRRGRREGVMPTTVKAKRPLIIKDLRSQFSTDSINTADPSKNDPKLLLFGDAKGRARPNDTREEEMWIALR